MMHHAQSRIIVNDVIAPYVECGPNHFAIVLSVVEARDLRRAVGICTVGITCFQYQRTMPLRVHGLFLPAAVNRLTNGGPVRLLRNDTDDDTEGAN
jgi:hypothetical protein